MKNKHSPKATERKNHNGHMATVFSKDEHETLILCIHNLLDERRHKQLPVTMSKKYSQRLHKIKSPKDLITVLQELSGMEYHPSTFVANKLLWQLVRNNWDFSSGLKIYRYLHKWKLADANSKKIMEGEIVTRINYKSPKFFWEMADFSRYMLNCAPNIPFLFYGGVNRDILLKNIECNDFDIFWGGTHKQLKILFPQARRLPFDKLQHVYVAKFNYRELNISVIECDDKSFDKKCYEYLRALLPLSIDSLTSKVIINEIHGRENAFISMADNFNARANIAQSKVTLIDNVENTCDKNPIVFFRALAYELKGFKLSDALYELLSESNIKSSKARSNYLAIAKVFANEPGRMLSYLYRLLKIASGDKVMKLLDLRGLLPMMFKDAVNDFLVYRSNKEKFYGLFSGIGAQKLVFYEQVCEILLKDRIFHSIKTKGTIRSIYDGMDYLHQQIGSETAPDNVLLYILLLDSLDRSDIIINKLKNNPKDICIIKKYSIMPEDFNKGFKRFCQIKGVGRAIELFYKYSEWQGLFQHQLLEDMAQEEYKCRLLQMSKSLDSSKFSFSSDFYACILLAAEEITLSINFKKIIKLTHKLENLLIPVKPLSLKECENKFFINRQELLFSLLKFMTGPDSEEDKFDYPFDPGESFWHWLGGERKQFSYNLKNLMKKIKKPNILILSELISLAFPSQMQAIIHDNDKVKLYLSLFELTPNKMRVEEFYACLLIASNLETSSTYRHNNIWLWANEFVNRNSDNANNDLICNKFLLFFEIENILIKLDHKSGSKPFDKFVELNSINSFKQMLMSTGRLFGNGLMNLIERNKSHISGIINIIGSQGIWAAFMPKLLSIVNVESENRKTLIENIKRCEFRRVEQLYAVLLYSIIDQYKGVDQCINDFVTTWMKIDPILGLLPFNNFYCDKKRLKLDINSLYKKETKTLSELSDEKLSLKK